MEKEKIAAIGRQAQDAVRIQSIIQSTLTTLQMTDISEATLDSLLNTCASLKHVSASLTMVSITRR